MAGLNLLPLLSGRVTCIGLSRSDRVFLLRTLRYKVNFLEKLLWKMFFSSLVD